jgi:hypothetical protein
MGRTLESMAGVVASGRVRTAGRIEFIRDQGPLRRDVRARGFRWEPESLRDLAKILWAAERAHGYSMSALRLFSKTPSSRISPDGLLGGRGYIQQVKELRAALGQAVEALSSFTDTVHDEINAPHWAGAESPEFGEIVEDVQHVKANPEGFVEEQFQAQVPEAREDFNAFENPDPSDFNAFENPDPSDFNPFVDEEDQDDEDDATWDWNALSTTVSSGPPATPGPASARQTPYSAAINGVLDGFRKHFSSIGGPRVADSSVPPETLPGPRVMHVGPAESPEEFGYFTEQDERPSDDPLGEGFSQFDRILENPVVDGVTGYTNPTDGDQSEFRSSATKVADTYSWLPGSENEKPMDYYGLGVTDEDVEWMRAHNQPDPPPGTKPAIPKLPTDGLWDAVRE